MPKAMPQMNDLILLLRIYDIAAKSKLKDHIHLFEGRTSADNFPWESIVISVAVVGERIYAFSFI